MGAVKIEDLSYTYEDYKLWEGNWELIRWHSSCHEPSTAEKTSELGK